MGLNLTFSDLSPSGYVLCTKVMFSVLSVCHSVSLSVYIYRQAGCWLSTEGPFLCSMIALVDGGTEGP